MATGLRQLKIDQLELDHNNPRISTAANQLEALQRILDNQGAKLARLAEDIVANKLSPTDNLLVLKKSGTGRGKDRYTVLEGNRRLAALVLMTRPAYVTDLAVP